MCPAQKDKKLEFCRAPFGETPILESQIFVRFSLFFISTYPENLIHLALLVYKLEIWVALFEENYPFWYHQTLQNIIFPLCLVTSKISCVQLKRLKSSNFGGPCTGKKKPFETPNFCLI